MKAVLRKVLFAGVMMLSAMTAQAQVDKIMGDWYTVDDKTGDQMSVVTIYQSTNGMYYGRIKQVLVGDPDALCVACTGDEKDKPVTGLVIIREFKEKDGKLVGGRVLDPDNGKWYYGKIYLKDGNLVLRGSLDKAGVLGRSQTWKRKK